MATLDRVPAVMAQRPDLKNEKPFKTVLSGDRDAVAKVSLPDIEKIGITTLTGMTTEEFTSEVTKWLSTAKDSRWNRPYTNQALFLYWREKVKKINGTLPEVSTTRVGEHDRLLNGYSRMRLERYVRGSLFLRNHYHLITNTSNSSIGRTDMDRVGDEFSAGAKSVLVGLA